jgi:hypothetical protein
MLSDEGLEADIRPPHPSRFEMGLGVARVPFRKGGAPAAIGDLAQCAADAAIDGGSRTSVRRVTKKRGAFM